MAAPSSRIQKGTEGQHPLTQGSNAESVSNRHRVSKGGADYFSVCPVRLGAHIAAQLRARRQGRGGEAHPIARHKQYHTFKDP